MDSTRATTTTTRRPRAARRGRRGTGAAEDVAALASTRAPDRIVGDGGRSSRRVRRAVDLDVVDAHGRAPIPAVTSPAATSRASRSASITVSTLSSTTPSCRSRAPCSTSAYVDPGDRSLEKGVDRHLVGGVQPGRRRPARPAGLVGQAQAGEGVGSGSSKSRRRTSVQSSRPNGVTARSGQAEGVGDREPHVGQRELGDGAAVAERDHRVDDRLRVHDDVDGVVADVEELVRPRSPRGPCS